MLFDNLPLPLPWYDTILKQDRLRPHVNEATQFAQLAPKDGLLPFQFRKEATSELPTTWVIKCVSDATREDYMNGHTDTVVVDLGAFITTALEWGTLDEEDYFMFLDVENGAGLIGALPDGLPAGLYYMEMIFLETVEKFTSEIFRVPDERFEWNDMGTCKFPRFKWRNDGDMSPIHYRSDDTFFNYLYLDSFITASEPEIEIEGLPDGKNELIPTFQKGVIKYKISALLPDFAKVALYIMQMHGVIELTTEYGVRTGTLKNIDVTASPTSDEAYSVVTITFEQMSLFVKTGCEAEMTEPGGVSVAGGMALTTTYCSDSGSVTALAASFPPGYYAELWAKVGGVYGIVKTYISRYNILAGWGGTISPGLGASHFKLKIKAFTYDPLAESAESSPTPSC